jgi:hypothetical protein
MSNTQSDDHKRDNLQAAAPELLTALERMIKTIPTEHIQPDVYANAIRAIKDARGTL